MIGNLLDATSEAAREADGGTVDPPVVSDPPYTLETALKGLFLPPGQFSQILDTFSRRKNLILQGPPGVGKTYIAKRVAWSLIGRKDRTAVQMVQFHQSYAYEDFIQGWRPTDTQVDSPSVKGCSTSFASVRRSIPIGLSSSSLTRLTEGICLGFSANCSCS